MLIRAVLLHRRSSLSRWQGSTFWVAVAQCADPILVVATGCPFVGFASCNRRSWPVRTAGAGGASGHGHGFRAEQERARRRRRAALALDASDHFRLHHATPPSRRQRPASWTVGRHNDAATCGIMMHSLSFAMREHVYGTSHALPGLCARE